MLDCKAIPANANQDWRSKPEYAHGDQTLDHIKSSSTLELSAQKINLNLFIKKPCSQSLSQKLISSGIMQLEEFEDDP